MKKFISICGVLGVLLMTGCSPVVEVAKTIWGSSTRALENARPTALQQTFACDWSECFDEVADLTVDHPDETPPRGRQFIPFIKNRGKRHIVVMGAFGENDTTEVGIFFDEVEGQTRIDVSSLSPNAKRRVAEVVFQSLDQKFPKG